MPQGNMVAVEWFVGSLFVGILFALEIGRRMGLRSLETHATLDKSAFGALEGVLFGLFGLLVAFTFSGAASRFDSRRMLIAEEANDIGTAYHRLDLLPASARLAMQDLFRQYLDSRLLAYKKFPNLDAVKAELARSEQFQDEIWTKAVADTQAPGAAPTASVLLLPAINQMIDITTTRTVAAMIHPPSVIYLLLFALAIACSVLAGYGGAISRRSWVHIAWFTTVMAVTSYTILDIEYPRFGLIRIDAFDQILVNVRNSMK
jgi:hypothetical protein